MIKIHVKHLAIITVLVGLYFLYQRIEFVEVAKKKKLLDIVYTSNNTGTCYVNYLWQTEYGTNYTEQRLLRQSNPNLKKGKTYIYTETEIHFKK